VTLRTYPLLCAAPRLHHPFSVSKSLPTINSFASTCPWPPSIVHSIQSNPLIRVLVVVVLSSVFRRTPHSAGLLSTSTGYVVDCAR
jgi:hypothetical protein